MNLRNFFFKSLVLFPGIALGIKDKNTGIKVGDVVKWNDWAAYRNRKHWVKLSVVTCVWKDGTVLLDDQRGIHSSEITVIGHCDTITASCGLIREKV